jgi:hypothetical protein
VNVSSRCCLTTRKPALELLRAYIRKSERYVQKNYKWTDPYNSAHPSLTHCVAQIPTNPELEQDVNRAVELDSNSAEGYYWLSALQYGENRVENLTRAIEHDPDNGKYYYRRSQVREMTHLYGIKFEDEDIQGVNRLRDQARQRGCQRVNEAAQHDFNRALELGYEEAVTEKNYKKPSFSFDLESSPNSIVEALLDRMNKKK